MATNKHAVIRYQTLDKFFGNTGRKYYVEDLMEACSKSIYEFAGKNAEKIKKRVSIINNNYNSAESLHSLT